MVTVENLTAVSGRHTVDRMQPPHITSTQNVRLGVQPEWTPPRKLREVPATWWDIILNGTLWALDLTSVPFKIRDHDTMRHAAYRQAEKRQLKISARVGGLTSVLYLQAYDLHYSGWEVRLPLSAAKPAPPMPLLLRTPVEQIAAMRPPRFPEAQERLMAEHEAAGWPAYPPAALLRHPLVGWMVDVCDCGTGNYRQHTDECPASAQLLMLETHLKSPQLLIQPPEVWAAEQERVHGVGFWER